MHVFGAIAKTGSRIERMLLLTWLVQGVVVHRADHGRALWHLSCFGIAVTPDGGGGQARGAPAPSGELFGCGPQAGAGRRSGRRLPGGPAGEGRGGSGGAPAEGRAAPPQTVPVPKVLLPARSPRCSLSRAVCCPAFSWLCLEISAE